MGNECTPPTPALRLGRKGPLRAGGTVPCGEGAVRASDSFPVSHMCSLVWSRRCDLEDAQQVRAGATPQQQQSRVATVRGPAVQHQRVSSTSPVVCSCQCIVQVLDPDDRFLSMEVFFTGEPRQTPVLCCVVSLCGACAVRLYGTGRQSCCVLPCVRLACLAAKIA